MKIVITGSNGLLGQKLVYKLRGKRGLELIATARGKNRLIEQSGYVYDEMDITNEQQVKEIFAKHLPDCIINTAATTNVDGCELEPGSCTLMNVTAVQYIVNALEELQSKNKNYKPQLIHLSTDFIFDGTHGPLTEDEKPNPLSHYARTKLQAENIVTGSKLHWAIARTMLVYGIVDNASRSNIVLWAKQNLEQKKNINVVDDQFRTPTLAEDLADGCILIAEKKVHGVYNISGKDFMS
ncbi:MAG TPA: SDR family oxidoreductase, partial [Bacteroidia bacterium]|nr:SDR family oxidoreductase [Bacteroidia bacterium]